MFVTYSHANTPLDQSEHGWYLRYFVNKDVKINHLNINPFAPEPPVTARADPGPFYPL